MHLYYDFGDNEQALIYVKKGLAYDNNDPQLLELQARSLKGLKRYMKAAAVYKYILMDLKISKEDHYWFQYQLAYSLYEGGDSNLAVYTLRECVSQYPQKKEAFDYLLSLLTKDQRSYEAVEFLSSHYFKNKKAVYLAMKELLIRAYNEGNNGLMEKILSFYDVNGIRDQIYYAIKKEPEQPNE